MERKIDGLGRVTIPKKVRKEVGFADNEFVELKIEENRIILEKRRMTPADIRRSTVQTLDFKRIAKRKEEYPKGTKVACVNMESEQFPIPRGMKGVVTGVDDVGSIHVVWENGIEAAILDIPGDALEKIK